MDKEDNINRAPPNGLPRISDILMSGKSLGKCSKFQRITNNLQWRQQFQNSRFYQLKLFDQANNNGCNSGDTISDQNREVVLNFQQIDNGEMRGIGTGAVVWPAAHVLVKYLERRYGGFNGLSGKRVIDIGSGTGFAGIAAAALGANVVLSDQLCVKDLINLNIEAYNNSGITSNGQVIFEEYNWDESAESLNPPFDIVLVSDCVLPKLYPIEPLVKAVHAVMDSSSLALFSYEHRVYPFFDPRHEFQRIAQQYQLVVNIIPLADHDPYYSCEDIEIWEVRKVSSLDPTNQTLPWPITDPRGGINLQNWGDCEEIISAHCALSNPIYNTHLLTIHQQGQASSSSDIDGGGGIIGSYIWASSVVVSRFLLRHPTFTSLISLLSQSHSFSSPPDNNHITVYDIGAGCGLTSLVLSLCNYCVIATDKHEILPLLQKNIDLNSPLPSLSSGPSSSPSSQRGIIVKEFDWKDSISPEIVANVFSRSCPSSSPSPNIILLSDCFYQSNSAHQLRTLINQISSKNTLLIIANELRSTLDDFFQCLRSSFKNTENGNEKDDQTTACSWNIQEIELLDSDLEIFRGRGGYLAVRPVKIFLCYQS